MLQQKFFNLDIKKIKVENNFEALTLNSYDKMDWTSVIKSAEQWFIDMPFAKRPVMYGHHAASLFLDDPETAIKFCRAGLISNPNDPQMLNNIAFSYAMSNRPDLAEDQLNKIDRSSITEVSTRLCVLATTGLVYYRQRSLEKGREFYLKAIQEAQEKNQKYYAGVALLNIAREEILLKSEASKDLYEQAMKIETGDSVDLVVLKDRLKDLMAKANL